MVNHLLLMVKLRVVSGYLPLSMIINVDRVRTVGPKPKQFIMVSKVKMDIHHGFLSGFNEP